MEKLCPGQYWKGQRKELHGVYLLYLHSHGHVEQDRHDHAGGGRVAGHLV